MQTIRNYVIGVLLLFCFQITYDVLVHKICSFEPSKLVRYGLISLLVSILIYAVDRYKNKPIKN